MANEVCFRTLHKDLSWKLNTYVSEGGYEALKQILENKTPPEDIIEMVK
jgi:NADH-quinone oxidoreductase subunit F